MIDSNDRTCLRQAITLDNREAQMLPEFFKFRIHSRTADNKRPELPPETAMHSSIAPEPTHNGEGFCSQPTELALDFIFEVLKNPGDRNNHRDPIVSHEVHYFGGVNLTRESNRTFKEHWNKQRL